MENTINILIYIHAFTGGLGLITGLISIFVQKGSTNHKKAGKIFSYAMLISALISLVVARMPNHENLFLFLIGVFTIYMILAGNRALTLKNKTQADLTDKLVSGSMLITSIGMLAIGIFGMIQKIDNSILYVFFGGFGAFMSLKDFQTFRTFTTQKNAWLISHLGRMIGALIASVTAFLVAGLNIGSILVWILPTIIGTAYIIYWSRRYAPKKAV
ncbi:hypothetical protein SAMN05421780_10411 [Flexibacter flexilis DSM 6793]|uniref:DUF2306 domain-containing protein n=1 Tax=Flexibacter flexilis DSM 6793 TaxID=927664 RepID=A0A1I1HS54_9BACT|nr:hypothetical protein [Flexibacter flexilis]SFC24798.1 hypothetical protein SAMN05421780_10411 [Flexibacter flexilis DSM 6793]